MRCHQTHMVQLSYLEPHLHVSNKGANSQRHYESNDVYFIVPQRPLQFIFDTTYIVRLEYGLALFNRIKRGAHL